MADRFRYSCTTKLALPSEELAKLLVNVLQVDKELQPEKVHREYVAQGNQAVLKISSTELKLLRVAVSSSFDMALVCAKTLREFAPTE